MLNLKDKVINNSRHIRIPLHGGPSISEFPCLTVICKKNPNITVEVEKENQRAMEVASIFKGMAKIIEVERSRKIGMTLLTVIQKQIPLLICPKYF